MKQLTQKSQGKSAGKLCQVFFHKYLFSVQLQAEIFLSRGNNVAIIFLGSRFGIYKVKFTNPNDADDNKPI